MLKIPESSVSFSKEAIIIFITDHIYTIGITIIATLGLLFAHRWGYIHKLLKITKKEPSIQPSIPSTPPPTHAETPVARTELEHQTEYKADNENSVVRSEEHSSPAPVPEECKGEPKNATPPPTELPQPTIPYISLEDNDTSHPTSRINALTQSSIDNRLGELFALLENNLTNEPEPIEKPQIVSQPSQNPPEDSLSTLTRPSIPPQQSEITPEGIVHKCVTLINNYLSTPPKIPHQKALLISKKFLRVFLNKFHIDFSREPRLIPIDRPPSTVSALPGPADLPNPSPDIQDEFYIVTRADLPSASAGPFLRYIKSTCPSFDPELAMELVHEGENFAAKFAIPETDPSSPENTIQNRSDYLAPFLWHLMKRADDLEQSFVQGMFVFQDLGNHRISRFFAAAKKAKPRASSHWRGRRENAYGMDVVQNNRSGLPGGLRTVLFGSLIDTLDTPKSYSYIKPESWGVGLDQVIQHFFDYLRTRPAHFLGTARGSMERKEHVSHKVKDSFFTLYQTLTASTDLPQICSYYGIAGMIVWLRDYLREGSATTENKVKIKAFVNTFKSMDFSLVRHGDEVIIENVTLPIGDFDEQTRLNAPFVELQRLVAN